MMEAIVLVMASVFVLAILILPKGIRRVVVHDGQKALFYRSGKFVRVLTPGPHWVFGLSIHVTPVDVRECTIVVQGQEILTADQLTVKVSVVVNYHITLPEVALRTVQNYFERLHSAVQEAIRAVVSAKKLEELLTQREQIVEGMTPVITRHADLLGITVTRISLRDFMLSGELKQAYAEMVKARLEGQASLERARAESAAIRSLLNATQLMESHPGLFQLRYLQAIEQAMASGKGHTLVVGNVRDVPVIVPPRTAS